MIRKYNSGEYFGERALRLNEPRAASCIAIGHVTVRARRSNARAPHELMRRCSCSVVVPALEQCVTLKKDNFEEIFGSLQSVLDHNMLKDTLRTAPLFRYLTATERESVLDCFEFIDFAQGDLIFKQGDQGTSRATRRPLLPPLLAAAALCFSPLLQTSARVPSGRRRLVRVAARG
jgi:hypothetical protein